MILSGFVISFGLMGCLLASGTVDADKVEIVTPEAIAATTTTPGPELPVTRPDRPSLNDSYVQAYMSLRGRKVSDGRKDPPRRAAGRREDPYNTVVRSSHIPEHRYPSLTHQGGRMRFRRPPPRFRYPPQHGYYNEYDYEDYDYDNHFPPNSWQARPYSSPSSELFSLLLPKKYSLKLLFKIILKFVLFKMLVKFIAVICLLFFIPVLKSKEMESDFDVEMRKLKRLDAVSNSIWNGIEAKNATYLQGGEEEEDQQETEDHEEEGSHEEEEDQEHHHGEGEDEDHKEEDDDHKEEYDEEEELKDIKKIAELADMEPMKSEAEKAVKFLRVCVGIVQGIVNSLLIYLRSVRSQENESTVFG